MLRTENLKTSERISAAIYFVTNFFDDKEPLKWKLRALSINLIASEVKDKSEIVREIISLFSITKNVGLVSDTNYDILADKLLKLEDDRRQTLDMALIPGSEKVENIPQATPYLREHIKDKVMNPVSVKKNSRQDVIMSILRRKKEVMIKDISPLLGGYSNKTIQRELSAMVKDGILKKSGEKRWSRYSLA